MRLLTSLVLFGFLLCSGQQSVAQLSSAGAGCSVNCGAGSGIFTITNIGSNGAAAPSIGSVTVPAGAAIVVEVTDQGTTVGTLSDGTNTYTLVKSVNLNNSGASGTLAIFASQNVAALSSATLSYTPHGTSANMSAIYVTTPLGAVIIDTAASASNFGNSTTPTITSGVPTNAGELFFAGVAQTSNSSIAQAPGWITPFNSVTTENPPLFGGHQTNPGPSATTFTPGGGTSNPWATVVTAVESSCPQSTALLARMSGSQNSAAVITAICKLVALGTWQKLDGFYVYATAVTADTKLNWVSTSFNLTTHGSCTFTVNAGWTGDHSSCYQDPGWIASTAGGNATINSTSIGGCDLSNRTTAQTWYLMGSNDNASTFNDFTAIDVQDNFGGPITGYEVNGGSSQNFTSSSSLGSWLASRTSSALTTLYLNGASVSTNAVAPGGLSTVDMVLMALNNQGTVIFFTGDLYAYQFFGGGLTATDAANIYNVMHTYLTTVGAPSGCFLFFIIPIYRRRRC